MTQGPRVTVLDYGSGNLHSATRALAAAGAQVALSADEAECVAADGLVVPGVGAFAACMDGLVAVGGHRIVARRLAEILPPLLERERREVAVVREAAGFTAADYPARAAHDDRPYRSPHYTLSPTGMAGGRHVGEITLAHHGVLMLAVLLASLPTMVIFLILQRSFAAGMTGAIK